MKRLCALLSFLIISLFLPIIISLLERRAYNSAKKACAAESQDPNNSLSEEERRMFENFVTYGRSAKNVSSIVRAEDEMNAEAVVNNLESIVENKKSSRNK